ncbi:MAG: UTP--glucose-1-phosphate uridylyltransferase GalU [Gammaproteobacteria bacterium]|nr:UTP--glucose-1-phosphate uridylyltransferase GalU [Gammaproteobacteria bacterium]
MNKIVRKAVFPVAGLGTRFLPATKANPKEMLPIVDKPLIQYAAEEAVAAGCSELIFVTSSSKRAIEDHFDKNFELETKLAENGKKELLHIVRSVLPEGVSCVYIRQAEALGLGHAVLCAKDVVGDEPFAVILADDLIDGSGKGALAQMIDVQRERGYSVIGVEPVEPKDTDKYGIVAIDTLDDRLGKVKVIVEKPKPEVAPSHLGVVGRYILSPRIFHHLTRISRGAGGEIQLTDGIARLLAEESVYSYQFEGKRYDCGNKLGYLQATVEYGLKHTEVGGAFAAYLKTYAQ